MKTDDRLACSGQPPLVDHRPPFTDGCSGETAAAPIPALLSVSDACRIFGRNERSIRRWVKAGHLKPIRVGRSLFFKAGDIQALIASRL